MKCPNRHFFRPLRVLFCPILSLFPVPYLLLIPIPVLYSCVLAPLPPFLPLSIIGKI